MSLAGLISLIKSVAKLAEVIRWAWKTFLTKRAEAQHEKNSSSIDAAVDRLSKPTTADGSRTTPPQAS